VLLSVPSSASKLFTSYPRVALADAVVMRLARYASEEIHKDLPRSLFLASSLIAHPQQTVSSTRITSADPFEYTLGSYIY
jgi:hypothetical protein